MTALEALEVVKVKVEAGVAEVTLSRPKSLNALNGAMLA